MRKNAYATVLWDLKQCDGTEIDSKGTGYSK